MRDGIMKEGINGRNKVVEGCTEKLCLWDEKMKERMKREMLAQHRKITPLIVFFFLFTIHSFDGWENEGFPCTSVLLIFGFMSWDDLIFCCDFLPSRIIPEIVENKGNMESHPTLFKDRKTK